MKSIILSINLIFALNCLFSQTPFVLSIEQDEIDAINDVIEYQNQYYFLQTRGLNFRPPYDFDNFCDFIITSKTGEVIDIINLNGINTYYHRILDIIGDEIYLVGHIRTDTCMSKLIISKFNTETNNLNHLSTYDLCENIPLKIKLVKGLLGKTFIDEYHSVGQYISKSIFEIDSNYQIILTKDSLNYSNAFSIDFSRKGYLINADRLKRFFDADFNFIKQKWFYEEVDCENEAQEPFGQNLLLIQTIQDRSDKPDFGFQVLLVDSMLYVRKKVVIQPEINPGFMFNPFYGGLEIRNENEIWVLYHAHQEPNITQSFFVVTKLDSNLSVLCQQFIGYDTYYRTYGLRLIDGGGAIVYGTRMRDGLTFNQGEDIYAMIVGQNCELPTTSTENGSEKEILSISAYPNPGINDLTFSMNGFDPSTLRVELFDELGKVLFSQKDLTFSIQVPDLPAGHYFYRIFEQERLLGIGAWVKQ